MFSLSQHLCNFIGTKESVCLRKEFNSHRIGLGHQHDRSFIVLGHRQTYITYIKCALKMWNQRSAYQDRGAWGYLG